MKEYIFTITYNFDNDYIIKKCNTYSEAINLLNRYLEEEIEIVKREREYTPSILKWEDDDITLVYEEGYSTKPSENKNRSYETEDCAYYRIFEVEM